MNLVVSSTRPDKQPAQFHSAIKQGEICTRVLRDWYEIVPGSEIKQCEIYAARAAREGGRDCAEIKGRATGFGRPLSCSASSLLPGDLLLNRLMNYELTIN